MKKSLFVLVVIAVFAFVSCATATPAANSADAWWNNPPADTAEVHYEVGVAQGSILQTTREWAKANANSALAQYVQNSVKYVVMTYQSDAGEVAADSKNMQAMQAFDSVSLQKAEAVLTGVTYQYQVMDDGTVYCLAKLPIGPVAEQFKEDLKEAFVKNQASEEALNMAYKAVDKFLAQ